MKFYQCETCGKIVAMVKETPVETVCCGQDMVELKPNETDGKSEAHVPVYSVKGSTVTVKVGEMPHPMKEDHHVEWIAIETEKGNQCRHLKAGDEPNATFALVPYDRVRSVYEFCSVHGLWIG